MDFESKPLTETLVSKYGAAVVDDKRDVNYQQVYMHLSSKMPVLEVFPAKDTYAGTVLLAAVVLEEYSLVGTEYPVALQVYNGTVELPGHAMNRAKEDWAAVLCPGTQHTVEDKVLFEPVVTEMGVARSIYPNAEPSLAERGIVKVQRGSETFWWLCVDADSNSGEAICPLGYVLAMSRNYGEAYNCPLRLGTHHEGGIQRRYYALPEDVAMNARNNFLRDAKDARPVVQLKSLKIAAHRTDEQASPFVASFRLGVYFYPA